MGARSSSRGVELLCVGTELLLGNIVNGNARWIAEQLASHGMPHFRQSVLGDNRERLIAFLQEEYPESFPRVRAEIQGAGGAAAKTTEDAATHP